MKLRSFFTSILASIALIGCVQEEFPALSNIEVTPSYFTLGVDGGTKELKVTSSAAWEITDPIPSWVTLSAVSGKGSAEGEAVTVTVAASTDTLARAAYLKFTSAGETQLVTVNQDAFIPDFPEFKAGDYWIMFDNAVATPLSSTYGYLYTSPAKEMEDGSLIGTALNIFTFKAVEGGFTIQDPSGQYYCMQGTYNSYNVYTELPEAGGVWTVKQVGKTAYQVTNVSNGKMMQFDPEYSSAGAYSDERGIHPNLVKVEIVPEPEPLGESMDIDEALEYKPELVIEGLVTASSTKGVILTDKSGSLYIHEINSKVAVGDSIKVAGKLEVYNKGYQLTEPNQYELVDSVKHEVKYPEAKELTKTTLPEMVKNDFLAQYVSVKGIVETDSYNNAIVTIGGYKVKTYRSHDSYADLKDKAYEFHGYLISYNEQYKEASLIVTKVSDELTDFVPEVEEPDDDEPAGPTYPTIAEVLKAGAADEAETKGVVVATYTRGALIYDKTAYILIYNGSDGLDVKIGDEVHVSGKTSEYGGMLQFGQGSTIEKLSADNEVVHPTPTVLDGAGLDSMLEKTTVEYIQYTGTLSVNGYYYNITVSGTSKAQGSLSYFDATAYPAAVDGEEITVKGYFIGVSSSKFVNTMTVSVE